jgi:hypothetical protein
MSSRCGRDDARARASIPLGCLSVKPYESRTNPATRDQSWHQSLQRRARAGGAADTILVIANKAPGAAAARLLGIDDRTSRRWARYGTGTHGTSEILLRLLLTGRVQPAGIRRYRPSWLGVGQAASVAAAAGGCSMTCRREGPRMQRYVGTLPRSYPHPAGFFRFRENYS